nr:hypothetical protein GCM10025730_41570 [Promicromonospora thailandica]
MVLVLRRLPPYFSDRPLAASRWVRLAIGVLTGLVVMAFVAVAPLARVHVPISVDFPGEAETFGGGHNVVNVTLVDIRAWDTVGEISVLLVAATGVASLVFLRQRSGDVLRLDPAGDEPRSRTARAGSRQVRPGTWLVAGPTLDAGARSVMFEVVTRLLFYPMILFALFLLFSGHNAPGGGFAAGLVAGLALVVRYLAGGRYELGEAAPVHPGLVLGTGLFLSAGVGLVALLAGQAALESTILDLHLPVLGDVHLVTSLFFDIGVFLVVIGLVIDILRTFGAELDRQADPFAAPARGARASAPFATAGAEPADGREGTAHDRSRQRPLRLAPPRGRRPVRRRRLPAPGTLAHPRAARVRAARQRRQPRAPDGGRTRGRPAHHRRHRRTDERPPGAGHDPHLHRHHARPGRLRARHGLPLVAAPRPRRGPGRPRGHPHRPTRRAGRAVLRRQRRRGARRDPGRRGGGHPRRGGSARRGRAGLRPAGPRGDDA